MDNNDWDSILHQFVSEVAHDGHDQDKLSPSSSLSHPSPTALYTPQILSQVPTPPESHHGSPDDEQNHSTVVSVSTTFHPGATLDSTPTDLSILSSDSVFFYVHTRRLLDGSINGFNNFLPSSNKPEDHTGPILALPEHSSVLNVVLHTIYHMSAMEYSPPLAAIVSAVDALQVYGYQPSMYLAPSTPLFSLVMSHSPNSPLECYALAASLDLQDLATSISPFLLSFPLASLSDEVAARIGPTYLKRLFFLHLGRAEALKRLLLPPPETHPPTMTCDWLEQKKLTRAWALATAYLAWEVKPDLSTASIETALRPLGEHLSCDQCKQLLRERINNLVVQWSVVKSIADNIV
ncbi:hypothetical protein OF83DRAFT_701659 [Amylostereum chailletii]|nr:hypothetical protein OF83DRAFT_701659 [Amylostereum chailletii]